MGDLHSIANYNSSSCCTSSSASLGWEYHNLGVFNADMSHSFVMGNDSSYLSPLDDYSDYSTGYLEDALFEFSSKRRRLLLFSDDQTNYYSSNPFESCWKENVSQIYPQDFGYLNQNKETGETMNNNNRDVKTLNEEASRAAFEGMNATVNSSSSSLNTKDSLHQTKGSISESLDSLSPLSVGSSGDEKKRKKVMIKTRVVYPFAVVKPGGVEGDVTLNDINERILMTPTRPVKHPVGDYACRPIISPDGPGLSGKAVVALTRIQTQGRGTITIIRTKG